MDGVKKLKIGIIIILIIEVIAIIGSFAGISMQENELNSFYDSLSYSQQNDLIELYKQYPVEHSITILQISGWLFYLGIGMTGFLLYKIWNKEAI